PPDRGSFHAPEDWLAPVHAAVPDSEELDLVPVVVKAGGGSFHHPLIFHRPGPHQAPPPPPPGVSPAGPAPTALYPPPPSPALRALPPRRRPVDGRVVLPGALGRDRRPHALASGAARADVAPAVEEQRRAGVLARVLDAAEEQRVIAAPVGALDPGDEMGQRAVDERRLAHDLEPRLGEAVDPAPGEAVREGALGVAQH